MDIFSVASSIAPLVFILVVTAAKDAFEDLKRHRTDNATNSIPVRVFHNNSFVTKKSEDIHVGDYIFVRRFDNIYRFLVFLFLLIFP